MVEDNFSCMLNNFVERHGGTRPIQKVLVANNGMAAVKVMKSIRKWSYETFGNDRLIQFVAMASPEDMAANSEFIRMADSFVPVPGGSNNNNYANVDLIVEIAENVGADAVWPGWGHASENPLLPDLLGKTASGIVFLGPSGNSMRALGDKISSTIVAQSANVPCIAWSGSGVTLPVEGTVKGNPVSVDEETYLKACVQTAEEGLAIAEKLGFPVMIKASEGGGGKGIRKVEKAEDFAHMFYMVQNEVVGSPIFVMRLASGARHLEVQVLADKYGNTITLYGRDCSVQRRHQKIIEEAPVSIADSSKFIKMEEAAVRLAKLVGYSSAGTIEYLFDPTTKEYFFLELNPRLQVEHPCSEMITNVNLPACQLLVGMGIPLYNIKDIRNLYNQSLDSTQSFDLDLGNRKPPQGHVVACRITAENPEAGFKPNGGKLTEVAFRGNVGVWGYFSVGRNSQVHEFADSQFGHIFAHAPTRNEAKNNMAVALKEFSIESDFRNTVEYLIALLETETFTQNSFTTVWLDRLIAENFSVEKPPAEIVVVCTAVAKAVNEIQKSLLVSKISLEKGQVPHLSHLSLKKRVQFIYECLQYDALVSQCGPDQYCVRVGQSKIAVKCVKMEDQGLLLDVHGKSFLTYLKEEAEAYRTTINKKVCIVHKDNDPSILRSPSSGKLVRYLVENGSKVQAGQPFAEVEVMKMYMSLFVTESGDICLTKQPGSAIKGGEVLATLKLEDTSKTAKVQKFEGKFPLSNSKVDKQEKIHRTFKQSLQKIQHVLDGYEVDEFTDSLLSVLKLSENSQLAQLELSDCLSVSQTRIPAKLAVLLKEQLKRDHLNLKQIHQTLMTDFSQSLSNPHVGQIKDIVERHVNGPSTFKSTVINALFNQFLESESLFASCGTFEDAILQLRDQKKDDLDSVCKIMYSHVNMADKIVLVLKLLEHVRDDIEKDIATLACYQQTLKGLANLEAISYAKLSIKARELLLFVPLPSMEQQKVEMEQKFLSSLATSTVEKADSNFVNEMVHNRNALLDCLPEFFHHSNNLVKLAAFEIYVRRIYNSYNFTHFSRHVNDHNSAFIKFQTENPSTTQILSPIPATPTTSMHHRTHSASSMSARTFDIPLTSGIMTTVDVAGDVEDSIKNLVIALGKDISAVVYLILKTTSAEENDSVVKIAEALKRCESDLHNHQVRRVTVISVRSDLPALGYFTFRAKNDYEEDVNVRHIEPALAYHLEFSRMIDYDLNLLFVDSNSQIHIYEGSDKINPHLKKLFVRVLVRPNIAMRQFKSLEYFLTEGDKLMENMFNALEFVMSSRKDKYESNHCFINVLPVFNAGKDLLLNALTTFMQYYYEKFLKNKITFVDVRASLSPDRHNINRYRFIFDNIYGGKTLTIDEYQEMNDPKSGDVYLYSLNEKYPGPKHLESISMPYPPIDPIQELRNKAQSAGTTYVYDFPALIEHALKMKWLEYLETRPSFTMPKCLMEYKEIILDTNSHPKLVTRPLGQNSCGMVAWLMKVFPPEYPSGRQIVVISNDINYEIGSFGLQEDNLFFEASKIARQMGIPRIYLSANSGARIGLADEIKNLFKVCWNDLSQPHLGFQYLYITEDDYKSLPQVENTLILKKIFLNGSEARYVITDIIGQKDGIGVENLQGSGMIAGETARAYEQIFTLSYVTCRSVGIGAYLVRLGQRVIQKETHPIILTGVNALNKLLGKDIYSSNLQIGGPSVMYYNGVTHRLVKDDLSGIFEILNWLSFVPAVCGELPPITDTADVIDRDVEFQPKESQNYDPRYLITGRNVIEGGVSKWDSGLFDKDSFIETMGGWAQTVVVGRARLGGIPCGVICVETRTIELVVPADPANPKSEEQVSVQAGQVWFPDSAYKTAQAIRDFNNGEQLPLVILANWRGFSGGQRDMYEQVLKYGSYIVDALKDYKQPIVIYIPPFGELRGGSWVVLDTKINSEYIEMYADPLARAGILEPEGIVSIKYRTPHLLQTMERCDAMYRSLKEQLKDSSLTSDLKLDLETKIKLREKELLPIYHQIALHFAELHDKPGRMKAKQVIREIVSWKESRRFFYQRIQRRLLENQLWKQYVNQLNVDGQQNLSSKEEFYSKLYDIFRKDNNAGESQNWSEISDIQVCDWIKRRGSWLDDSISRLATDASVSHVVDMVNRLPEAEKKKLLVLLGRK